MMFIFWVKYSIGLKLVIINVLFYDIFVMKIVRIVECKCRFKKNFRGRGFKE